MVAAAPHPRPPVAVSATFERVSTRTRLRFLGNGFLRAETEAPKWPLASAWPFAETKRPRASPPIRRFSPEPRKSPLVSDCVVGPGGVPTSRNFSYLVCPAGAYCTIGRAGEFFELSSIAVGIGTSIASAADARLRRRDPRFPSPRRRPATLVAGSSSNPKSATRSARRSLSPEYHRVPIHIHENLLARCHRTRRRKDSNCAKKAYSFGSFPASPSASFDLG
jgi:hypothetical protein